MQEVWVSVCKIRDYPELCAQIEHCNPQILLACAASCQIGPHKIFSGFWRASLIRIIIL